jgi:phosphate starvation-inducible PhoH-like protein
VTQSKVAEARVRIADNAEAMNLFGKYDQNLKLIEENFDVSIVSRGEEIAVQGPAAEVAKVESLFANLLDVLRAGNYLSAQDLRYAIKLSREGAHPNLREVFADLILITHRGKQIRPKTHGQQQYVRAVRENSLVFGIGPAGTGKTYLAVALAVAAYKNREFSRIIVTRPAVEAGERLGFLPGDLEQKVHPYLRPIYDALFDTLGLEGYQKLVERGLIEIAPLAYMRGRTLDDAFVILDEAQNTTPEQMKMFLTRLGLGSKAVVTGDITQVDLPPDKCCGLEQVRVVLKGVRGISFSYLTERDVVRHELVQRIVRAYERFEDRTGAGRSAGRSPAKGGRQGNGDTAADPR